MNRIVAPSLIVFLALSSCKARTDSAGVKTNANVTGDGQHLATYWSVATAEAGQTYHCWYRLMLDAKEVKAAQESDEDIAIAQMVKQFNAAGRSSEIQAEVAKIKQKKLPTVEQKVSALFRKSEVAHPRGVTMDALSKEVVSQDRWQNAFLGGPGAPGEFVGIVLWVPARYLWPTDGNLGRATVASVAAEEKDSTKVRSDVHFDGVLLEKALAKVGHSSSVICEEPVVMLSTDNKKNPIIRKEISAFAKYIQTVKMEESN